MEAIKAVPEKREGTKEKPSGIKKLRNCALIQQNLAQKNKGLGSWVEFCCLYTTQKLCHFGRYVARAKLFRLKGFVWVSRAGVFRHMGKFSSPRFRSKKPRSR